MPILWHLRAKNTSERNIKNLSFRTATTEVFQNTESGNGEAIPGVASGSEVCHFNPGMLFALPVNHIGTKSLRWILDTS